MSTTDDMQTGCGGVLITAFEPFGGDETNPTELILSGLPDTLCGRCLHKKVLPVEFFRGAQIAIDEMRRLSPEVVILLGQAGGRSAVTPERVAINVMDAYIPDNAGFMPTDEVILPDGEAAYFSTLPIKDIVAAVRERGLPSAVSNSAGTYVCNSLMYRILHECSLMPEPPLAGFIHVPFSEEQVRSNPKRAAVPCMSLDAMIEAITVAIRVPIVKF